MARSTAADFSRMAVAVCRTFSMTMSSYPASGSRRASNTAGAMRSTTSRRYPEGVECESTALMAAPTAPHEVWPSTSVSGIESTSTPHRRPEHRRVDDVAGVADHEEVAEALVKDDLGGDARVRAAEYLGERVLVAGELGAT